MYMYIIRIYVFSYMPGVDNPLFYRENVRMLFGQKIRERPCMLMDLIVDLFAFTHKSATKSHDHSKTLTERFAKCCEISKGSVSKLALAHLALAGFAFAHLASATVILADVVIANLALEHVALANLALAN